MNEYKMVCEKDDIRWQQMDEGWLSKVKLDIQVVWVTPSSGFIFSWRISPGDLACYLAYRLLVYGPEKYCEVSGLRIAVWNLNLLALEPSKERAIMDSHEICQMNLGEIIHETTYICNYCWIRITSTLPSA